MRARRKVTIAALAVACAAAVAAQVSTAGTAVSKSPVVAYQAAGDVGGGVLAKGTSYPPATPGHATLKRGSDWIQADIQTSGLPAGAYTVWWVVFDTPDGCSGDCGEDDLFNGNAGVSVFLATGGEVKRSGRAAFHARYTLGDDVGEPGRQLILGDGRIDPSRAEVHNVVKYHGPPSADPAVYREQISTLRGGCDSGANALDLGEPFGVQCFDPQAVVYPRP